MRSTTKTIFLTLVLIFIGSVSVAQDSDKLIQLKKEKENAQAELQTCRDAKGKCDDLTKAYNEKNSALIDFESKSSSSKEQCKSIIDEINSLNKEFGPAAREEALNCMEVGFGSSPQDTLDLTGAMLRGLSGIRTESQKGCAVESAKSTQAEKLKEKLTALEKLERDLEKVEEKLIKRQKEANDTLADLNKDRLDLKKEWEIEQEKQGKIQTDSKESAREAQIKMQEAIQKANAELLNARQEYAKVKRRRYDELLKAGVQSFNSMDRICRAQVKEYFSKAGYNTKKRAKSLGAGAKAGGSKVEDVNSFYNDCIKSMEVRRQAIYEDSSNYEVQKALELKNRLEVIATLEMNYKQISVNYNQALEQAATALNNAQRNYAEKDSNIAIKINQYQIASEQERLNLENQKNMLIKKIQAAELSNGKIQESEVVAGVENWEKYISLVRSLSPEGETPCPEAARFKSEIEKFKEQEDRISEAKQK